jgi:hypothetical protein
MIPDDPEREFNPDAFESLIASWIGAQNIDLSGKTLDLDRFTHDFAIFFLRS